LQKSNYDSKDACVWCGAKQSMMMMMIFRNENKIYFLSLSLKKNENLVSIF
jgi:hypothetical protein